MPNPAVTLDDVLNRANVGTYDAERIRTEAAFLCGVPTLVAGDLQLAAAPANVTLRATSPGTLDDPAVVRADEALDRAPLLVECQGLPGCRGTDHDERCAVTL